MSILDSETEVRIPSRQNHRSRVGGDARWIARCGNLDGCSAALENTPDYLEAAIERGFDVSCEVVYRDGTFWIGSEERRIAAPRELLVREEVWCQAKDVRTLDALYHDPGIHCFFQALDDVSLTSRGFLWTHPRCRVVTRRSIVAVRDFEGDRIDRVRSGAGVCSDRIAVWRDVIGGALTGVR